MKIGGGGGRKGFSYAEGGGGGGGTNSFGVVFTQSFKFSDPRFSHFVAPHPRN